MYIKSKGENDEEKKFTPDKYYDVNEYAISQCCSGRLL